MEKNENKVYTKPQYKCGICGRAYNEVQERMNCEMKCVKIKEEKEKQAAEAKKKAEKDARKKEVDEAFKNLLKLHDAYVKDYGYYEYECSDADKRTISIPSWPNKFWHNFWF
jgi:hypothetical protein